MILDAPTLRTLTGHRRSDAQRRALDRMGIPYTLRPDGRPVVLQSVVEAKLGAAKREQREPELRL